MRFDKILTYYDCQYYIDYFNSQEYYKDNQVKNSDILHNWPKAMDLCIHLRTIIENKTGLTLQPHQAWIRKYVKGNVLHRHWDGEADYALSIMLGQSDDIANPLLIYYTDEPTEVILEKGDGYFFQGGVIEHERKEVQSDYIYGMYLGYLKTNKKISLL